MHLHKMAYIFELYSIDIASLNLNKKKVIKDYMHLPFQDIYFLIKYLKVHKIFDNYLVQIKTKDFHCHLELRPKKGR